MRSLREHSFGGLGDKGVEADRDRLAGRQLTVSAGAAIVAAVRVSRPQKLWPPWRASSIRSAARRLVVP
jgi:hypothetical protein